MSANVSHEFYLENASDSSAAHAKKKLKVLSSRTKGLLYKHLPHMQQQRDLRILFMGVFPIALA